LQSKSITLCILQSKSTDCVFLAKRKKRLSLNLPDLANEALVSDIAQYP